MKESSTREVLQTQSIFLIVVSTLPFFVAALLVFFSFFPISSTQNLEILIDEYKHALSPKPVERLIFVISVIVTPLYALFLIYSRKLFNIINYTKHALIALPLIATAFFVIPLLNSEIALIYFLNILY